jgi:hypothetical protein
MKQVGRLSGGAAGLEKGLVPNISTIWQSRAVENIDGVIMCRIFSREPGGNLAQRREFGAFVIE